MNTLQQQLDANNSNEFVINPGEYEGPLIITHPCIIVGSDSTLWSNSSPVLKIESSDVTIKNLRVEYTGKRVEGEHPIAIATTDPRTKLIDVEVNGDVKGFSDEAECWNLPSIISLGDFASNRENTFSIDIPAAAAAEINNKMNNIKLSTKNLVAGTNSVTFTTDELRDNTILYGEILIKTAVSRRIYITGKATKDAPEHHDSVPVSTTATASLPVQIETPTEIISPTVSDKSVTYIQRGQRLSIKDLEDKVIKIIYEHKSTKEPLEIDGYAFLLQENGKVKSDNDLIFFGNSESQNAAVKASSVDGKPLTLIDLRKIQDWVNKIAVCYSIYGDNQNQNFALIDAPVIRIMNGNQEIYRFELSNLTVEKTVVAIEIYRYKGEWKINFISSGYKSGLNLLCEDYGVDVE